VRPLDAEEHAELVQQVVTEAMIQEMSGVPETWGEAGYSLVERNTARPTMEVNGLLSGWTGEGSKTVLPAKAMAKLSCRLVANQDPREIYELVKAFIAEITPTTVHSKLTLISAADPAVLDLHMPEMKAAVRSYERVYGVSPLRARGGGTLAIIADLKNELRPALADDELRRPQRRRARPRTSTIRLTCSTRVLTRAIGVSGRTGAVEVTDSTQRVMPLCIAPLRVTVIGISVGGFEGAGVQNVLMRDRGEPVTPRPVTTSIVRSVQCEKIQARKHRQCCRHEPTVPTSPALR